MPIDKNNIDMMFVDDLTEKYVEGVAGADMWVEDIHTGELHMTHAANELYWRVREEVETLVTRYLRDRENAPDSPHQFNPKK